MRRIRPNPTSAPLISAGDAGSGTSTVRIDGVPFCREERSTVSPVVVNVIMSSVSPTAPDAGDPIRVEP